MIVNTISRRYAKAVFKAAVSFNNLEEVYGDLDELSDKIETSREFRYFMLTPRIKKNRKKELIAELFKNKFSEVTISFLLILLDKRRQEYIKGINEYFKVLYKRHHKIMDVTTISSVELTGEEKDALKKTLEKITGKVIKIIDEVDPSILGGLIIKIENKIYDNSIVSHLEGLKKEMVTI